MLEKSSFPGSLCCKKNDVRRVPGGSLLLLFFILRVEQLADHGIIQVFLDDDPIGRFIAEQRKKQNMTQKQLAEKLDISDKAVSKWETGGSQS